MYDPIFYKNLLRPRSWQMQIGAMVAKKYNIKSVFDLGCGIGAYLEGFQSYGSKVRGVEFSYDSAKSYIAEKVKNDISFGDASKPLNVTGFELAMSSEVAEHISEDKADVFVYNLTQASERYIFFSAAPPRGRVVGEGHVNEQPMEYWVNKIEAAGFKYSQKDSLEILDEINKMNIRSRYLSFLKQELIWFNKV
jgi:SAM-dependent methyltransferase